MGDVVVQMSMSVDGYIAGPNESGVERLHRWMFGPDGRLGEGLERPDKAVFDALRRETGALISGRRLYDITNGWDGTHPFGGLPIFVVTRRPPRDVPRGTTALTFVTDGVASAVAQAKEAAAGKSVYVVGGANIDQQLLDADLVDELRIDLIPILLGGGTRLFETIRRAPIDLKQMGATPSEDAVHLRYRVSR